ncbi:MAG: glycosyltransferase family 2 protein [bacterium]
MKLLSVAVPSYNAAAYMEHCVETLLSGGEEMEILIVDDGSQKDDTPAIADRLEREHPSIVRAIHQENAGHGGAVMTGLKNATGLYFRVVDADDWLDEAALQKTLSVLRGFAVMEKPVDLLVSNFVYDKPSEHRATPIHYRSALRPNRVLTWDEVGHFMPGNYLLMHALIYRTAFLQTCGLNLPLHTFYVDNLYATVPLQKVETLYYLDVDLYHYFIGREGQSVQQEIMIRRIDQQLRVNRLLFEQIDAEHIANKRQQYTVFNYQTIVTVVSCALCIVGNTPELLEKRAALWDYIREEHPWEYRRLRKSPLIRGINLPGAAGRAIGRGGYHLANRLFNFN